MTKLCKGDSVRLSAALATALCLIPAGALGATDINHLALAVDPDFAGGTGYNDQNVSGVGLLSLSGTATGGFNSSGDGSSSVTYGIIKLEGEFFGSGDTVSTGNYNDGVTITAPGVPTGTIGTLMYRISVSGTLQSLAGASGASFQLQANFAGAANQISVSGEQYSPDLLGGAYKGAPFGTFTASTQFYFGEANQLAVWLTGGAGAAYDAGVALPEAKYDLAHSCYWQGISDVEVNGVAVSSFTATGLTGVDYSKSFQSVPEPATLAPLALGALLLRRRKRP